MNVFNIKDSYITPIILSFVDKYIKDIRLQDTQVSLWSGAAVFQNLSLRLDVLNRELALPFSFVSGQIHELAISVPWTKLQSEPIKITINTIECVLKLKHYGNDNLETSTVSSSGSREARSRAKKQEIESAPGYVQGLVNKIVSNITVECNNVILKYLEEDMVLSLNVRSLVLQSANEAWQPAFAEMTPAQLILRKLVTLHDLTVCLDRRNSSGKIEFYEEPLLYRCSMDIRISRTYQNIAASQAKETKFDLKCNRLDFSVSDQQMPMLLRVLRLGLAWYLGELKELAKDNEVTTPRGDDSGQEDQNLDEEDGESWMGWAWSLVPSLSLVDEDYSQDVEDTDHILMIGFYIDSMSVVFKLAASSSDRCYYGTKKIKFTPLLGMELQGCFMESTVVGIKAVNVTTGASQLIMKPIGEACICGVNDLQTQFLTMGSQCENYVTSSMFSREDEDGKTSLVSWEEHLTNVTEGALLFRTPAFAMDYRYLLDMSEGISNEYVHQFEGNLESSNLPERALCRLVVGPMQLNITSGLIHRVQEIMKAASSYNYPPYVDPPADPVLSTLSPPSEADIFTLERYIPLRAYQLTMFKPVVNVSYLDHPEKSRRRKDFQGEAPYLSFECQCLDATHVKPMYPNRIVTITCQIAAPTENLFSNCHRHSNIKLLSVSCNLVSSKNLSNLLLPCHLNLSHKYLIYPHLWPRDDLSYTDLTFDSDQIVFVASKQHFLSAQEILLFGDGPVELEDAPLPYMELILVGLNFQRVQSAQAKTDRLLLKSCQISTGNTPVFTTKEEPLFSTTFQHSHSSVLPNVAVLALGKFVANLDPALLKWLSFEFPGRLDRRIKKKSIKSGSVGSKTTTQQPDSFISSEKLHHTVMKEPIALKDRFRQLYKEWQCAFISIDVSPSTVNIPIKKDQLVVKLPCISFKSANQRQGIHILLSKSPVILPPTVWRNDKDTFPWNLNISSLSCDTLLGQTQKPLLHPVTATCTIGVSRAESTLGLCVHFDTPLLQIDLAPAQVGLVVKVLQLLTKLTKGKGEVAGVKFELQPPQNLQTPPATITAPSIHQQPMSVGSISEPSTQQETEGKKNDGEGGLKVTAWVQWTLARILLNLYSSDRKCKITFDMEDMMTSVDLQQIYLKMKSRITTASIQHFQRDTEVWRPGQHLGLIVRCNDDTLSSTNADSSTQNTKGLIDVTFTRAQSSNVHKKWTQQLLARSPSDNVPASSSAPRYISEVDIKLCPLDVILSASVFQNFISLVEPILNSSFASSSPSSPQPIGYRLNNNTLPLVYLDMKDLRLFLPCKESSPHDFCIVQLSSIRLVPHVVNPLSRVYIRPDIYQMAQQANILSVPGSQVEDRQYQLDFKSLSVETGKWTEFERYIQVETITEPLSENPAAEWNKESFRNSELSLLTLVQKFDVSFMAAPAIVYQEMTGDTQKDLLVCGHSAEVNATSDISLDISTNQISLITSLGFEWLGLAASMTGMLIKSSECPDGAKMVAPSDSGIEDYSSVCSPPIRKISKEKNPDLVPLELLVTASSIKVALYQNREDDEVEPLLHVLFSQPHLVLALHSLKQRIEVSCFDLALRTSNVLYQQKHPPGVDNYGISLLKTKGGDPHQKTGVPPSVLTLTWNNFLASSGGKLKVDLGRPIHVQIGQHAWELYQKLHSLLPRAQVKNNQLQKRVPIDILQHKIDLSTSQMVLTLKLGNHQELIASVSSISGEVQPKVSVLRGTGSVKVRLNISSLMTRVAISGRQSNLVNPWSLVCDTLLTWDSWFINLNAPRSQTFLDCGCLMVDFGPDQLECLNSLTIIYGKLNEGKGEQEPIVDKFDLKDESSVEEHYSDDVRAGAFQFVDSKGSELPLPYQVLFSTKPASMTWRYPHPRALTKVHIYPVPFEDDIDEIPCQLQFWSDCEECFKPLLFFRLSSSHYHKLELPFPKDKQHSTAASVWRVLLEPSAPCLSPRAFAACLKVNSYFNPMIVPRAQCLLKLSTLKVNIVCQNSKYELPQSLAHFKNDGSIPDQLPLTTLVLDSSSISLMSWPHDTKVEFETRARLEVVDLATLTVMHVVNSFVVEGRIFRTSRDDHSLLEISLLVHPIMVKFGPAAGHVLLTAMQLWKDSNKPTQIIPARYVVCNDTAKIIIFRQYDAAEEIILGSRQCNFYAWRSASKKPHLQTKLALSHEAWSSASSVEKKKVEFIKETKLVMRVEQLSTTQTTVIYMGQLVLGNTLKENLEIQVKVATEPNGEIFNLPGNSTCASIVIDEEKKMALKVRFQSLASAWSGDIPLEVNQTNNMPWLAKVPLQDKGQFLSVWCRIFIQECDGYKRFLAVFSPLYSVRSLLPTPILLSISTPGLQVEMSMKIEGRGGLHELYCPGTVEHSHKATVLPLNSTVDDATTVPLSYGMTQLPSDVCLQGRSVDVDEICSKLHNVPEKRWPYVPGELDFLECSQPPTNVQISYDLQGPHYTTLVLQLRPWALFVNCLPLDALRIVCQDWSDTCNLPPGGVIVPPVIEGTFQICNGQSATPALQLANEEWNSNFYMPRISGVVPREGSINTTINLPDNKMFLLTLTSEVVKEENNLRALSIHPTVLVSCSTEVSEKMPKLLAMPIVLPTKSKSLKLPAGKASNLIELSASKPAAFTQWHQMANALPSSDLTYHLLIQDKSQSSGWACPLTIPMPGSIEGCASRQSFSVGSVPLVLTTHFRKRQVYAVISIEKEPQLLIHNSCQFPLLFGQANIDKGTRGALTTVEECENILWRNDLGPGCNRPYMLPALQQSFPELQPKPPVLALLIALGSNQVFSFLGDVAWSEPISVSCCGHAEQFVRLPGHGDVRVRSHSISGGTTYLYIECVSRIEISAKEIRARLQPDPHSEVQVLEHDDKRCLEADVKIIPEWQANSPKSHILLSLYARSAQVVLTNDASQYSVELLTLTLDNIYASIRPMSGASREVDIAVGDVQLDNQMFYQGGYDFPVIFKGQDGLSKDIVPMRICELRAAAEKIKSGALLKVLLIQETWIHTTIKSLNVRLKPINLYVEDTLLLEFNKISTIFNPSNLLLISDSKLENKNILPLDILLEVQQAANPLQIHRFSLEPLSLVVSVHTSVKVFIALDRSPLNFSSFERHRICTTSYHLGHELTRHYLSGALFKAGWVVGSLEILGSPGAFAVTVGSGIRDFVCLPFTGILQGPWGFLNGVTHGSASLMKHLTAGTLSSITNLASSVARNLDRCSLDQEHVERAEEARRQRSPQGIGQGVMQGLSSFGISLLGAISGIAHHPLQAIVHQNSSPLSGLVTGVGLGLVGVITKPLSGAAELVAMTGQGLLHGAGWSSLPQGRCEAVVEHSWTRNGAHLRHAWKSNSLDDLILMSVEATVDQDGPQEAVVLLLSTQYLMVIVQDTEQVKHLIPVTDVKPKLDETDTMLLLISTEQSSSNTEVEDYPQARVEDYVRHSGMVYIPEPTTSDGSTPPFSITSENSDNNKPLRFLISPQMRNYFFGVLVLAQRQSLNKGFATL